MTSDLTLFGKNDLFTERASNWSVSERHNMRLRPETLQTWAEAPDAMAADQNDSRLRVCPMKRREFLSC
jgi:hypothetical protein